VDFNQFQKVSIPLSQKTVLLTSSPSFLLVPCVHLPMSFALLAAMGCLQLRTLFNSSDEMLISLESVQLACQTSPTQKPEKDRREEQAFNNLLYPDNPYFFLSSSFQLAFLFPSVGTYLQQLSCFTNYILSMQSGAVCRFGFLV
jgi:hypothetical protein